MTLSSTGIPAGRLEHILQRGARLDESVDCLPVDVEAGALPEPGPREALDAADSGLIDSLQYGIAQGKKHIEFFTADFDGNGVSGRWTGIVLFYGQDNTGVATQELITHFTHNTGGKDTLAQLIFHKGYGSKGLVGYR